MQNKVSVYAGTRPVKSTAGKGRSLKWIVHKYDKGADRLNWLGVGTNDNFLCTR
jgi:hypothetical protein